MAVLSHLSKFRFLSCEDHTGARKVIPSLIIPLFILKAILCPRNGASLLPPILKTLMYPLKWSFLPQVLHPPCLISVTACLTASFLIVHTSTLKMVGGHVPPKVSLCLQDYMVSHPQRPQYVELRLSYNCKYQLQTI